MKISSHYPATITVDDPATGEDQAVRIRVKRLNVDEGTRFRRDYYRAGNPLSAARIARTQAEDEQAKNEKDEFVVDDADIRSRRLAEMTPEDRASFHALEREDEAHADAFLAGVIRDYVKVEPDQLFEETDGNDVAVTTGEQMLRLYGARQDVLRQLLRAVNLENTLPLAVKKALRSLSDSAHSLAARQLAAIGKTSAGTAADAGTAASAGSADATGQATPRSGSPQGQAA